MRKMVAYLLTGIFLFSFVLAASSCKQEPAYELDESEGTLYQYEKPNTGDEIAIFHTNLGKITVRFFPEEAPKAVENFIELAQNGYYNNCTFYRVVSDFVIQSGNPENTLTGGESKWGKPFEDEFSAKLHNLYGALCMANTGEPNSNGSQFYFVTNKNLASRYYSALEDTQRETPEYGYTDKIINAYKENGGCPWLDRAHTVFGQVIDGYDVLDKIGRQQTDSNDVPLNDIVIESIEITQY